MNRFKGRARSHFIACVRSKKFLLIGGAIVASLMFMLLEPSKLFAQFAYEGMSPNCHYRLETWKTFFSIDYGFVRLYDATTGRLVAESDVVFLFGNAEKFWPRPGENP